MTSNIVKRKLADGTVSGINLWKVITFKTQNALDPNTLFLGIYPTDAFLCAQNNMHKGTSYSIVCKCKLSPIVQQGTNE